MQTKGDLKDEEVMKKETFFEFIRYSIDNSITEFKSLDDMDWDVIYDFSMKH